MEAAGQAVALAAQSWQNAAVHKFSADVEAVQEEIERCLGGGIQEEQKRFYAIKLLERDDKITARMSMVLDVERLIRRTEEALDDDADHHH